MGLINFYSHIDSTHKTVEGTGPLKNLFPEVNWESKLILVKGNRVSSEYSVKEKDIVFVRSLPKSAVAIASTIAVVSSVIAGVTIGYAIYQNKKYQQELEDSQSSSSTSTSSTLPFLKGATNQAATGRSFPYVMGNMYFTPYRLCPKYYTVSGEQGVNQYVYLVLECGFSPVVIDSISIGNINIYEADDKSISQSGVFGFIEDSTYYNAENLIEIRQDGDFENEEFNKKIVSNFTNTELEHEYGEEEEPYVVQLEENAKSCDLCILFDGLRSYDSSTGYYSTRTVTVNAYWSNSDNPDVTNADDWNDFPAFEQQNAKNTYTYTTTYKGTIYSNSDASSSTILKDLSAVATFIKNHSAVSTYTAGSGNAYTSSYYSGTEELESDRTVTDITVTWRTDGDNKGKVTKHSYGIGRFTEYYYARDIQYTVTWQVVRYEAVSSNTFTYNSKKQLRFLAHKDFTPEESYGKQITVKLVRSQKSSDSSATESVYLNYVNTEIYDTEKTAALIDSTTNLPTELVSCKPLSDTLRDKCTRIGIKMKATSSNEDLSDNINIIVSGSARVWHNTTTYTADRYVLLANDVEVFQSIDYYYVTNPDELEGAVSHYVDGTISQYGFISQSYYDDDGDLSYITVIDSEDYEEHTFYADKANDINGTTTTSKGWSVAKEPTRNPAAWALEVLTSNVHDKSVFEDTELDLESFGAWYEYCEENSLYCDAVLTDESSKKTILDNIFTLANASLVYNAEGLYEVCIDKAEDYSVALLNTQDISDISVSKSFERKANGRKITFVNRDTWTSESVYYMKDGTSTHSSDDTITEVSPPYVTDYSHAIKYAHRQIAQDYLQPKTINAVVGNEGAYYPLYSCVEVQLPHLSVGITSAVVRNATYSDSKLTSIEISDFVTFEDEKSYGIIMQIQDVNGKQLLAAEVTGSGTTKTLTFTTPVETTYTAQRGNILSFGEIDSSGGFTLITSKMKITGISRSGDGYKLELKNYDEDLYTVGSIPDYISNATQKKSNSEASPNFYTTPVVTNGKDGEDGKSGGYQDYKFAVGDFDLTTDELLLLTWYDSPPEVPDGKCLYAATKWIEGE